MRSLTWSLDKAPAFSNAKFLIIGLPPCLQQQASVFHHNAYPPAYGQSGANFQPNVLSYYHDQSYGSQVDDKESWYAPPQPPQEQIAHGYDGTRVSRDREDQFQLNNRTISAIPPASSEGLTPRAACETADRESTPHVPAQTAFEDSRGRY